MKLADYKPLPMNRMREGVRCIASGYWQSVFLRLDSPAIDAMTDFRKTTPVSIGPDATLTQAEQKMIACGVRFLLVLDYQRNVLGLITARDVVGERPVKVREKRGCKFADLKVADLMVPRHEIDVFEIATVERAEVGHVIATQKELGRQHTLVVDRDPISGEEVVRGIFSATQIGRLLGINIQPFEVARTFAEIEAALTK